MKVKREENGRFGIIKELFQGKGDQTRGAQVKTPRGYLDKPIQLLYPLQLHCNRYKIKSKQDESYKKKLNVEAKEFRPKRTAGAIALTKIKDIAEHHDSENDQDNI